MKIETLASQIVGCYNSPERSVDGEINACQNQVIGEFFAKQIKKAVDNTVKTVESRRQDAVLTAFDNVVFSRVEMAVRSNTGSSGHGPNSVVHNPDKRDFIGNEQKTLLKSASTRLGLNIDQNRIDETRDIEK